MTPPVRGRGTAFWESQGRELAGSLGEAGALVVVADDPASAAALALGIGRVESGRRRVAIADLVGELPALQQYVSGDDPHGISDSFNFGVSLNRIAYPVDGAGELFVMPSGTDAVESEGIFRNPRWKRLAAGFREVGALLLIVTRPGVPGLEDLIGSTDGAIAVADAALPPGATVVARVLPSTPAAVKGAMRPATGVGGPPAREADRRAAARSRRAAPWLPVAAAVALVAGIGGTAWYQSQRTASGDTVAAGSPAGPTSTAGLVDSAVADANGDLAREDGVEGVAGGVDEPPVPVVVSNRGDSAQAAAWGVEVVATNTQSGAIFKLMDEAGVLPAATYSPVARGSERLWFYVVSGAYAERTAADSLLRALRANGTLDRNAGQLRRLPYALLVQTGVSRENAPAFVAAFVAKELPVYALLQADGSASLFAGAFESPDQTGLLAAGLRARGVEPKVVYRIGRTF